MMNKKIIRILYIIGIFFLIIATVFFILNSIAITGIKDILILSGFFEGLGLIFIFPKIYQKTKKKEEDEHSFSVTGRKLCFIILIGGIFLLIVTFFNIKT